MQKHTTLLILVFTLVQFCCNSKANDIKKEYTPLQGKDSIPQKDKNYLLETTSIHSQKKNKERPTKSIIQTTLDTSLLFTAWVGSVDAPHADFVFSGTYYYVVDYDGDGNMPYSLIHKTLKVYYKGYIQEGEIISLTKELLTIKWKDAYSSTDYIKWKK
jgi:hypothetical protein